VATAEAIFSRVQIVYAAKLTLTRDKNTRNMENATFIVLIEIRLLANRIDQILNLTEQAEY